MGFGLVIVLENTVYDITVERRQRLPLLGGRYRRGTQSKPLVNRVRVAVGFYHQVAVGGEVRPDREPKLVGQRSTVVIKA